MVKEGDMVKPGRELDALVAERVMGLKTEDYAGLLVEKINPANPKGNYPLDYLIPRYSESIEAAWEVVEKIKTTGRELEIELTSSADNPNEWTCGIKWFEFFEDEEQQWGWFYFTQSTAPHAICLAALKAVGVET